MPGAVIRLFSSTGVSTRVNNLMPKQDWNDAVKEWRGLLSELLTQLLTASQPRKS